MKLSLIVAKTKNNVIGFENSMPWHLPADLKHFKTITMGKPIVMGRKTYDSIGRALPGRRNIVISRQQDLKIEGCELFSSIEDAMKALQSEDEVIIIGGSEIFKQNLSLADYVYLTLINAELKGDAFFLDLNLAEWKLTSEEKHASDVQNKYAYCFQMWQRCV